MDKITIASVAKSTECEIFLESGLLDKTGELLQNKLLNSSTPPRFACISDSNVAPLYMQRLGISLQRYGFEYFPIIIPAGEEQKNYNNLQYIISQLLAQNFTRNDIIIALGGGMISDIAGFSAAIFLRGIRFITIATSLLAQIDASLGGKTGINNGTGKNLIGSFYSPLMIINDPEILHSLPPREFRAGYAEMIKYGLLNDKNFFHFCANHLEEILTQGPILAMAIAHCIRAKTAIIADDYFEKNKRALLNLGHSFGHAFETASDYKLLHGEAVSVGLSLAFAFSAYLDFTTPDIAKKVQKHLQLAGLPTQIKHLNLPKHTQAKQLLAIMRQDKKNTNANFTLILAKDIGQSFIADDIAPTLLQGFLEKQLDKSA
ncbi:MAG: 3-dehydroquinate synthase [Alphaproteobacteria bacterium]|nr:3-dehydroquinate synthase [Alphaproteobacteria bacterium]